MAAVVPGFIGRSRELDRLVELLESHGAVLLVGAAGSGKTALLEALEARTGSRFAWESVTADGRIPMPPARGPWVVDGVEHASPRERSVLMAAAAAVGKLIAVSRQLVPGWSGAVLRLEGLDRTEARELWRRLDEASGAVTGFPAAYQRSGGNPRLLRAVHEGRPDDPDADAVLTERVPAARRVALALAEVGCAVPLDVADAEAVAPLIDALAIEPAGAGWWRLSPRFRGRLLAGASAAERAEAGRRAEAFWNQVAPQLTDLPAAMVTVGAAQLERRLAELPPERRTVETRLARARLLVELNQTTRALCLVQGMTDAGAVTRRTRAEIALRAGRLELAVAAVETDLRDTPSIASWISCLATGEVDDAILSSLPPEQRHSLTAWQLWMCGELAVIETEARAAEAHLREAEGRTIDVLGVELLIARLAARRGALDEARRRLAQVRADISPVEQPRTFLLSRLVEVAIDEECGACLRAVENLSVIAEGFASAGEMPMALVVRIELARLLGLLGRSRQAAEVRHDVESTAARMGLAALAKRVRRLEDFQRRLWTRPTAAIPEERRAIAWRRHAEAAMQEAASGHATQAGIHLRALATLPSTPDYAVERMLASITRAALKRLDGGDPRVELAEAAEHAADGNVDAQVFAALGRQMTQEIYVTPAMRRVGLGAVSRTATGRTVLDARQNRLSTPERTIALDRRPVLARLLCALAERPGAILDKEALTVRLWGVPYNPLVHDNALKANVHRLNRLIAPARLTVSFYDHGYRLQAPGDFLFIEAGESTSTPPAPVHPNLRRPA